MARLEMAPLKPEQRWQQFLYKALEKDFDLEPGEVDEYTRTLASSKTVVDAISAGGAHRYIMYETSLSRKLAESIGVLVSSKNRCQFCADAHTRSLEVQYRGPDRQEWLSRLVDCVSRCQVDQLPGYDQKEKAALRFALTASRNAGGLVDEDFEQVRATGYSEREILDMLAVVALFEMHNRIVIALELKMIERFRRYHFERNEEQNG